MSNINHRYTVQELSEPQSLTYLFFSEGGIESEDVLKIIQFGYMQHFNNRPVYNLGFGDFDLDAGEINDGAMTNNGDAGKFYDAIMVSQKNS